MNGSSLSPLILVLFVNILLYWQIPGTFRRQQVFFQPQQPFYPIKTAQGLWGASSATWESFRQSNWAERQRSTHCLVEDSDKVHQGWPEVGEGGKDQAQSPTITSGARSWRSSEAHTGPRCWLPAVFRRQASLDLEGGDSSMEPELLERRWGEESSFSSCCCSSLSSLSASCRFIATACPAKNVRSWALPPLEKGDWWPGQHEY